MRKATDPLDMVIELLAVYRATKLLQQDDIPPLPAVREKLMARYGATPWGQLLDCPWCLSVWVGGASVALHRVAPRMWRILARVLASSAVAGLISEYLAVLEPTELLQQVEENTRAVREAARSVRESTDRLDQFNIN